MKRWYQSKTVWLGASTIVGAAVTALTSGASWRVALVAALGALHIYLRALTDKPLGKAASK